MLPLLLAHYPLAHSHDQLTRYDAKGGLLTLALDLTSLTLALTSTVDPHPDPYPTPNPAPIPKLSAPTLATASLELKTEKQSAHSEVISSVAFSPDGTTIVSGSRDETIKV